MNISHRLTRFLRRRPTTHSSKRTMNIQPVLTKPLNQLSEDETIMKETVSKLARINIVPYVREMENKGQIKESIINMCFENGLMGIEIDPIYGGLGYNFMSSIVAIEEIAKIDMSVSLLVDIHNTLINSIIMKLGTKNQKEMYLPRLAKDTISSFALSEAGAGSDAFGIKLEAQKDGSDYILNGTKMWISNAGLAGLFLVMANTNPSLGYKGITCFIVERNSPGLIVGKAEDKLGIRASGTHPVIFDNVRVPQTSVLGEVGQGYKIIAGSLNEGRIGIAAQMTGVAQGCFDATIPYVLERKQFNRDIFSFQAIQHQIATTATEIEAARLLTYNAAQLVQNGTPYAKEASMAKYYAAEVAQKTCTKCIDWLGGVGFTKAMLQEKFYRDVKIGSIYEGTYNIQLNTIAKYIKKEYQD